MGEVRKNKRIKEKVLLYVDSQVVAGIYKDGKIERIK